MIFVTGGTGLLGSNLIYKLLMQGEKVKALIRPGKRDFDTRKLFGCFPEADKLPYHNLEWIEGDILDVAILDEILENIDEVYHCAAIISFDSRDNTHMIRTNVIGTANIVNACLLNHVKKLCYVSSIAALGQPVEGNVIDESARWKASRFNNGYAISKYGGEREVWRGIEEGLNAVIVNPSVILGAGCHSKTVNSLFTANRKLLPFKVTGTNGYVDVEDVANACILLMKSDISGERFVLNSENLSNYELFNLITRFLGKKKPFIRIHKRLVIFLGHIIGFSGRFSKKKRAVTIDSLRAALSTSFYSGEKFAKQFNYKYIPIETSLHHLFERMKMFSNLLH